MVGFCIYSGCSVFAQSDQAGLKLQAANNAVGQAFNAVLGAERAGANVTGLLAQLNVAGDVLAQAENSYRSGYYNAAGIQADRVLPLAQAITISAQDARHTASVYGPNAFLLTIAFTGIGASVFVWVLFLVWRRFKRVYLKKLLGSKPQVTENTA
jgi:hypothetical protein